MAFRSAKMRSFAERTATCGEDRPQESIYSITSGGGALDASRWTSVAGNYDAPPGGDGSVDANDSWTIMTGETGVLNEAVTAGGDGGLNNGGTFNQDIVLTLVPEPGTIVLAGIGLLALAGYAARRD